MWFRLRQSMFRSTPQIFVHPNTNVVTSLSPLPVVPVSLPLPLSSVSFSSLVSTTPTLPLPAPPRPSRTPSRLPSLPSSTPTDSSLPTCGPRPSSPGALWRNSAMFCARARSTKKCGNGDYICMTRFFDSTISYGVKF